MKSAVVLAVLLLAAPAVAQTYSNGGPQPGDQGIGVMPLPTPGRSPSQDGIVIGQPQVVPGTGQGADQGGTQAPGSATDSAIGQAVGQALDKAIGQDGQQAGDQAGQQNAGQDQTQGQTDTGQGGFVADGTGLGHVTNSSKPGDIKMGPRYETVKVTQAPGGVVRWLDKVSGRTVDLSLADGQSKTEGRLTITLKQCRYPVEDPSSNAYAFLTIHDKQVTDPIFKGWMIASSPALDPLDSPRYDVWLLHCTTS